MEKVKLTEIAIGKRVWLTPPLMLRHSRYTNKTGTISGNLFRDTNGLWKVPVTLDDGQKIEYWRTSRIKEVYDD